MAMHATFFEMDNGSWHQVPRTQLVSSTLLRTDSSDITVPHAVVNHYDLRLVTVILSLIVLALILLPAKSTLSQDRAKRDDSEKKPQSMRFSLPWFGHAIQFYFDRAKLAAQVRRAGKGGTPLRLSFFNNEVTVVSGFEHVSTVWRSRVLDTKPAAVLALTRLFETPAAALKFWADDDSGTSSKPHPKSTVLPQNRLYYHTHRTTHAFMNGSTLKSFANRFQTLFLDQVLSQRIESEWTEMPDLYAFVQTTLSTAAVEAMCGPALLALNPSWIEDFWAFDKSLPKFFSGFPQIMAPAACKARTRCLEGVKAWHKYAKENFDEQSIDADGHDPFFGSSLMRSRQEIWKHMEPMDANATASEDLGIIWGENSNSIPAAFWAVAHIVRDPVLLSRVRDECQKCYSTTTSRGVPTFDIEKLTKNALLQSIWSEVLRLYVALFIVRGSDHDDLQLDHDYRVKKGEMIVLDTYTAHHDPEVWSTGATPESHPLDRFWADRFLIYPNEPSSGPLKRAAHVSQPSESQDNEPRFSTSGLSGAWIAFGGGRHQCPGKNFAKQEIILCIAIMCSMFDVEIAPHAKLETDPGYYGLGTLPQKSGVPCKIRRR